MIQYHKDGSYSIAWKAAASIRSMESYRWPAAVPLRRYDALADVERAVLALDRKNQGRGFGPGVG